MTANELMLGDWVDVYHELPDESGFYKPLQVTGLHQNDGICFGDSVIESPWNDPEEFEEEIKPIPLTSEILEKNKFPYAPKADGYFVGDLFLKGNGDIGYSVGANIHIDNGDGIVSGIYYTFAKIRYVHELKHVLRLCGIDKEITL